MDVVVEMVGPSRVIRAIGIDRFVSSLTEEQKKQLKQRLGVGEYAVTEAEWLSSTDPKSHEVTDPQQMTLVRRMLEFVRDSLAAERTRRGRRKLRLFTCACCRHYWSEMNEQSRGAVELAERFADGLATKQERWDTQRRLPPHFGRRAIPDDLAGYAVETQDWVAAVHAPGVCYSLLCRVPHSLEVSWQQGAGHAAFLQDIFGNPFRVAPRVNRAWRTWRDGTVTNVARSIYEDRAFDRLPILADALEDAGCDNADILAHCRGPGPHVRGCWVVDLILGKS